MEERLNDLIESKAWHELTADEKAFVISELGSETEYETLRRAELLMRSQTKSNLVPDAAILASLSKTMSRQKHPSYSFFAFRIPAYATAVLVIFASVVGWLLGSSAQVPEVLPPVIVMKTDTVYQTIKPDTVVLTKVLYRTRYIENKTLTAKATAVIPKETTTPGVSMKEKEELDRLLVSGVE